MRLPGAAAGIALRHPRRVLAAVLAVVICAGAGAAGLEPRLSPYAAADQVSASAGSTRAAHAIVAATGSNPADDLVALVSTSGGRAATRARFRFAVTVLRRDPAVQSVRGLSVRGDPVLHSLDGRRVALFASLRPLSARALQDAGQRLGARLGRRAGVTLGGEPVAYAEAERIIRRDLLLIELITFPLVALLAFYFFRGLVAALLPPVLAGIVVLVALGALRLGTEFGSVSIFSVNLVTALAIGLSIDFSLYIVSRYREERARGLEAAAALRRTYATAGQTVLTGALTIAGSLSALLIFPEPYLRSLGASGVLVAVVACGAALLVLPALLVVLGDRIDALAPARLQRSAAREARPLGAGGWYRLSRAVLRRPLPIALLTSVAMLALAVPALGLRALPISIHALPSDAGAARVQASLQRDFDPPLGARVDVVIGPASRRVVAAYAVRARALPGVAAVPAPVALRGRTSLVTVLARTGPPAPAAERLVRRLRALRPGVLVGGVAALAVDDRTQVISYLPVVLALVVMVTLTLLFSLTGSVLLPLKSVLMNALTVTAATGVVVLVMQDGDLPVSHAGSGGVTLPTLIFLAALGFGLSTDYGVFVLARIKELRDGGAADGEAVAAGIERTGRLVTAAALMLCAAIGALTASRVQTVEETGIGVAAAVLLDTFIVRALLVPSLMALLGRANWWAPAWLRRGRPSARATPRRIRSSPGG